MGKLHGGNIMWTELRKGRHSICGQEYFITFNTYSRTPLFLNLNFAHLFCRHIQINETKTQCKWLTWVLMPDHFHGLLRLGTQSLPNTIAHLKGGSAFKINKLNNHNIKIWQKNYYDHALRKEEDRQQISRYILANPLRKGLVCSISKYPYWNSVYM